MTPRIIRLRVGIHYGPSRELYRHVEPADGRTLDEALAEAGCEYGDPLTLVIPPRASTQLAAAAAAKDELARSRNLRAVLAAWRVAPRSGCCIPDFRRLYVANERRQNWPRKQSAQSLRTYTARLRRLGLVEPTGTKTRIKRHDARSKDHPFTDYRITQRGVAILTSMEQQQ